MLRQSCANWVKLNPSKLEDESSDRIPFRCIAFVRAPSSVHSHSSEHCSGPSRSFEKIFCTESIIPEIRARRELLIASRVDQILSVVG